MPVVGGRQVYRQSDCVTWAMTLYCIKKQLKDLCSLCVFASSFYINWKEELCGSDNYKLNAHAVREKRKAHVCIHACVCVYITRTSACRE